MKTYSRRVHLTLQHGLDTCYLTPDVFFTLILFAPGDRIIEEKVAGLAGEIRTFYDEICDYADAVLATALRDPDARQLAAAALEVSACMVATQCRDLSDYIGYAIATQAGHDGRLRKKRARRVMSRHYQWRAIRQDEKCQIIQERFYRLLSWYRKVSTDRSDEPADLLETRLDDYWRAVDNSSRAPSKLDRSATRRAARLATSLLGEETVTAFMKRQPVLIRGTRYAFRVSLKSIIRNGHGGINTELMRSDGEQILADLCVYFDNMVPLDQLVAIHLYMTNGMEEEIVKRSNFESLTLEGCKDSFLMQIIDRKIIQRSNAIPILVDHSKTGWFQEINKKTKSQIQDKLFIHITGYNLKLARSMQELILQRDQ